MLGVVTRNVHQALPEGMHQIQEHGVLQQSRNGEVLVFPYPFITEYRFPLERVIFWKERDANPFFHFFEFLWMLAGREDVDYVSWFNRNIHDYSDDGVSFNGAYGRRWLSWFGHDQIKMIASSLKKDPTNRRMVLTMFDGRHDLCLNSKDVPCNTHAYFQVDCNGRLNMMVCNRSNDLIWGAYGANAVHFSYLLEYVSALSGHPVGIYWQVSMNTHVYVEPHGDMIKKMAAFAQQPPGGPPPCPYSDGEVEPFPLVSIQIGRWQRDFSAFMRNPPLGTYSDQFFTMVAQPLWDAWEVFKEMPAPQKYGAAKQQISACAATDWRRVCWEWIDRREDRWRSKQQK